MGCGCARLYHDKILQADEACDFAFSGGRIGLACRRIRSCPDHKWRVRRAGGGSVVGDRVSGKRKLSCFAAGLRLKVRKRYANELNAFGRWEYRSDKTKSQLMQFLFVWIVISIERLRVEI